MKAVTGYFDTLFAKEIYTDKMCVKKSDGTNVCLTGDEVESLMNPNQIPLLTPTPLGNGGGAGNTTGSSTEPTVGTSTDQGTSTSTDFGTTDGSTSEGSTEGSTSTSTDTGNTNTETTTDLGSGIGTTDTVNGTLETNGTTTQ